MCYSTKERPLAKVNISPCLPKRLSSINAWDFKVFRSESLNKTHKHTHTHTHTRTHTNTHIHVYIYIYIYIYTKARWGSNIENIPDNQYPRWNKCKLLYIHKGRVGFKYRKDFPLKVQQMHKIKRLFVPQMRPCSFSLPKDLCRWRFLNLFLNLLKATSMGKKGSPVSCRCPSKMRRSYEKMH